MKVLTFGEIMLRLKAPGHERFFQSPMLEATFGGGEANVAVSLANYGMDAEFLTVLPQNDIADACIREPLMRSMCTCCVPATHLRMPPAGCALSLFLFNSDLKYRVLLSVILF